MNIFSRTKPATASKPSGPTASPAAMNIWLHKQVMTQLAAHGGKVPAELKD